MSAPRPWSYLRAPDGRLVARAHGIEGRVVVRAPGASVPELLRRARSAPSEPPARVDSAVGTSARVLFFESLMNAEMPHNDAEISQGVLHMISALKGTGAEVRLANVKMAITGRERPVSGLDTLEAALSDGPVNLVVITLLEGYWEGVLSLVRELRALGCRGHVALGGVMPTLAPEHVAAHFPDASFVCRGAGEVFLPRLCEIVGDGDIDCAFTDGQISALSRLDGLIAIDRAGGVLVSANSAAVVTVPDLDRVSLDLSRLSPRHLEAGVEIATSRGCVHRCTFCSIIGRESYQARSAGGVIELLQAYDQRYSEMFADGPRDKRGRNSLAPQNAYRVHISDDDFACDRARALAFFQALPGTPFRLASCQVSVADLCMRRNGILLAEPDAELLDAIRPECFDDHGRSFPDRDFVADHRTRTWSSYLQLGVESFSDTELVRLGKGYKRAHVRAIVAALAERGLHHDAYFILCNADTTAMELVEVLDEVVRLKLAHPVHFHVRFPVVARLVAYFTSAAYRRHAQQGRLDRLHLRDTLAAPGYPEFDYPLVEHEVPADGRVDAAVDAGFFTDEDYYAESYRRLRALWHDDEALARALDDRLRRRVFELLDQARKGAQGGDPREEARMRGVAEGLLGPVDRWIHAFQRYAQGGVTRLVVIPTWQCELRCNYCYIPKQDGRVMARDTLDRAVGLLLSSERPALTLQFFGGEALVEWDNVRHAIESASHRAAALGKTIDFVLSSNGYSLDAEKLRWLEQYPVKLELSLDGDPDTQRRFRAARVAGDDSYAQGIAPRAREIVESGLAYDVIMVCHPTQIERLCANYLHIVDLGFRRVQINFALGKPWTVPQRQGLAEQLFRLAGELDRRPGVVFVNAENAPMPMRLNAEITVDWDGSIYGGNAFLHETEHKAKFRLGHLDERANFDRYWMDAAPNSELVKWSYEPAVTANNLKVGAVMADFVRWFRGRVAR